MYNIDILKYVSLGGMLESGKGLFPQVVAINE